MKTKNPWSFCETPQEKCTMNYCDDNGCLNRKRCYVPVEEILKLKNNNENKNNYTTTIN